MHQSRILSALLHQLLVIAALNNAPLFQHQYQIAVLDGTQAVCNSYYGTGRKNVLNGFLNVLFGNGINGTGGLIQNNQLLIATKGAGKGQQLTLTLRQVVAIVLHHKIVAAFQLPDKGFGIHKARGLLNGLIIDARSAQSNIKAYAVVKQENILLHHRHGFTNLAQGQIAQLFPVDGDGTPVTGVGLGKQTYDGGLTGARSAHQSNAVALAEGEGDVFEDIFAIGSVAEGDVFKYDVGYRQRRDVAPLNAMGRLFFLLLKQRTDVFQGREGALYGRHLLGKLSNGDKEAAEGGHEDNQNPNGKEIGRASCRERVFGSDDPPDCLECLSFGWSAGWW